MTTTAPRYVRGRKVPALRQFAEPVIAERLRSLGDALAALMQDVAAGAHENMRPDDQALARMPALMLQRTATQLALAIGALKPGGGP